MPDLIQPGELATWLRVAVDPATEPMAIRHAQGWMRSALGRGYGDWPDPAPDDLWAWAIELAAIAYRNPDGLDTGTAQDNTTVFALARRAEILTAVAESNHATGGPDPMGSFPPPDRWPG